MTSGPHAEVGTLLDRYLIALDADELDDAWARSLFTGDALVEFPVGRHRGVEGMAAFHRTAMAKFSRTQHLNSPAIVGIDGDEATLRANLISTQVLLSGSLFTTGTRAEGHALRTTDGWRLHQLSFHLVWVDGTPPPAT